MKNRKKGAQGPSLSYTCTEQYKKTPKRQNPLLQCLGHPHVESFNYLLEGGLASAIEDLLPVQFSLPNGDRVKIEIEDAAFSKPNVPMDAVGVQNQKVYPTECRQRAYTYKGDFKVRLQVTLNDKMMTIDRSLGSLPVMVKSKMCHLDGMSPEELIKVNEHTEEWGGYFIIKGHERLIRMLLVTRRNYPISIKRPTWKTRGNLFSDYGVLMRCVQPDQTSTTNVLHFINNGTAKLMFSHRKVMYYAPLVLMLKCLVDYTDHHIYNRLLYGKRSDLYYVNCVQNMLRELHEEGLHTSAQCKQYLGKMFRVKLTELPDWYTDEEVTDFLLKRSVLIHLPDHVDKYNALVIMTQKLFDLVQNKCKVEGADAVMVQELLLGGHLYLQILKERLQTLMIMIKANVLKKYKSTQKFSLNPKEIQSILRVSGNLEGRMESFLATGTAPSNNVALHQYKGLSIMAENINRMRYMSHFKSIHRGAFFMEMRTTEARALLPDAWGFVCPVHTPDGAPCGLLNHLTMDCQVTPPPEEHDIPTLLAHYGMESTTAINMELTTQPKDDVYKYPVQLDGKLIGYLAEDIAHKACTALRSHKVKGDRVPITTEIVLIPKKKVHKGSHHIIIYIYIYIYRYTQTANVDQTARGVS